MDSGLALRAHREEILNDPILAKLSDRIRVIADIGEHNVGAHQGVSGGVTISAVLLGQPHRDTRVGAGFGGPG